MIVQQDANNSADKVSEQDLQVVTGGCPTCGVIGARAETRAELAQSTLHWFNSTIQPLVRENAEQLTKVAKAAKSAVSEPVQRGRSTCANADYLNHALERHTVKPVKL